MRYAFFRHSVYVVIILECASLDLNDIPLYILFIYLKQPLCISLFCVKFPTPFSCIINYVPVGCVFQICTNYFTFNNWNAIDSKTMGVIKEDIKRQAWKIVFSLLCLFKTSVVNTFLFQFNCPNILDICDARYSDQQCIDFLDILNHLKGLHLFINGL